MKRFPCSWGALGLPLTFALLWCLPVGRAQAAVTCTATMTNVAFGNVNLVAGTGLTTTGTLKYSCKNGNGTQTYARVCFNVDAGAQGAGQMNPRQMTSGANKLTFQLYQPPGTTTVWGSQFTGTPTPYVVDLTLAPGATTPLTSVSMQGVIQTGQAVPAGSYRNQFSGNHTAITVNESTTAMPAGCSGTRAGTFRFNATAKIVKACVVTAGAASNIQLGPVSGVAQSAVNTSGSNTISVSCTKNVPYYIGLAPSNGSKVGAGVLSGTGSNPDKVPYQLHSVSAAGPIWGNTATRTTVGNGVQGTGTGLAQSTPVFAVAPSANFTPDSYSDTVTVRVNY